MGLTRRKFLGAAGAGALLTACGGQAALVPAGNGQSPPSPTPTVPTGTNLWARLLRRCTDISQAAIFLGASSVAPGERVDVYTDAPAGRVKLYAFRIGDYQGTQATLVAKAKIEGGRQSEPRLIPSTRSYVADWQPTWQLDTTEWQPGAYLVFAESSSGVWSAPLTVRSSDLTNKVVLVLSDLTSQAYNEWGGRSSYRGPGGFADRSRAVSFQRPYTNGRGTGKYIAHDHPVVALAEKSGVPLAYLTMSDLELTKPDLTAASGLVFLGHSEYWTTTCRQRVTAARDSGVDLAFLGANTMYWRTRLSQESGGLLQTIYKSAAEDPVKGPTATARFRDNPSGENERSLVGQDYECYPATGDFTITEPDFFAFKGTGVDKGDVFTGLIDTEVDRAYPGGNTPENLQIVAASPTWTRGRQTTSTATYYTHQSGAGVFAVGTMGWVMRGLRGETPKRSTKFAEQVTTNVLTAMSAGGMGKQHPARPNLDQYNLPTYNTTGAA